MAKPKTEKHSTLPSVSPAVLVSPEFNEALRVLSLRQAAFVREYIATGHGKNSAIAAGYAVEHAASRAYHLLHDNPKVAEAVRLARADLAQHTIYDTSRAMAEFDQAAALAIETKNANAFVRAVELRSRLHGLIREKADITVATVDVSGALAEARERVANRGRTFDAEADAVDIFDN